MIADQRRSRRAGRDNARAQTAVARPAQASYGATWPAPPAPHREQHRPSAHCASGLDPRPSHPGRRPQQQRRPDFPVVVCGDVLLLNWRCNLRRRYTPSSATFTAIVMSSGTSSTCRPSPTGSPPPPPPSCAGSLPTSQN